MGSSVFQVLLLLGSTVSWCHATAVGDYADPDLPSYLLICHQRDPSFNECVKTAINSLLRNLQNGSAQLGLQPLDPYDIPLLEVKEGTGQDNVTLWMTFKHSHLLGLSHTDVISVKSNLVHNKLEVVSKSPRLDVFGDFLSDGAVLTLPLSARGRYAINMSDVTAVWLLYFTRQKLNGRRFLEVDELDVDVIPSSISYHFGDALDGDNNLGAAMNGFINENSHEIFTAMKPKLKNIFKEIFGRVASTLFKAYPEDRLLPL